MEPATGIDWDAAATTLTGVIADSAPVMTALIGVSVAFFAFRRILRLIGR